MHLKEKASFLCYKTSKENIWLCHHTHNTSFLCIFFLYITFTFSHYVDVYWSNAIMVFLNCIKLYVIKFTNFKCRSDWYFSTFTKLCDHHNNPALERFHHSSKISHTHFQLFPIPTPRLWQPLTHLLAAPKGLSFLDISWKWNHIMSPLPLTSFTQHFVFEVHPCRNLYQYLIVFYFWVVFHCTDRPRFV